MKFELHENGDAGYVTSATKRRSEDPWRMSESTVDVHRGAAACISACQGWDIFAVRCGGAGLSMISPDEMRSVEVVLVSVRRDL